jgi:hypothetical protein
MRRVRRPAIADKAALADHLRSVRIRGLADRCPPQRRPPRRFARAAHGPPRYAAMARLENPGAMDIATNAVQLRVVASLKAVNTIRGGLLALTDRRLVYLGRTLVGQDHLKARQRAHLHPTRSDRWRSEQAGQGPRRRPKNRLDHPLRQQTSCRARRCRAGVHRDQAPRHRFPDRDRHSDEHRPGHFVIS